VTDFLPLEPKLAPAKASRSLSTEYDSARLSKARHAAQKLEATFLAEMLKAAGFGEQKNSLSGGTGEDQFASFHRQAIADKIAEAGGIGLSEHFLRSMMETRND